MGISILFVDDEEHFREATSNFLISRGYEIIPAGSLTEAREQILKGTADIILLDVVLPDGNGLTLLNETSNIPIRPSVVVITAQGDIDMAVEAMKNGATDFLQKPINFGQLEKSLQRATENVTMRRELTHFRQAQHKDLDYIIGTTPHMISLFDQAKRAATASVSILITGETGTGKNIFAKAIHKMGPRSGKPFIAIDCGAIQSTVFESELFGHEPGAFTSAEKRKIGLMETADGGVLFLDEISSMPVETQVKLLRALEDRLFRRVGGNIEIRVDVQVIAASNRDINLMMENGTFRTDLYYRLKVMDLVIPPLREHKSDIPELVGLFIRKYNPHKGTNITNVTPRAMDILMAHHWPGNIRELSNIIERAMIFCDEDAIDLPHLPRELVDRYSKNGIY